MNIISTQQPEEMAVFIKNCENHHVVLRSYSIDNSSELEMELTPQEMTKLVDFIIDLKEKSYLLK